MTNSFLDYQVCWRKITGSDVVSAVEETILNLTQFQVNLYRYFALFRLKFR